MKCPVCGYPLEHVRMFNEDLMGKKGNPYIGWICTNPDCESWWCDYCEAWHPYGSRCAVAMVRNLRGDQANYLTEDPSWRHQEERIKGRRKNGNKDKEDKS